MSIVPDRSPELIDPEQYFRNRFRELFDDPYNFESKSGKRYTELLEKIPEIGEEEECLDLGCGAGIGTFMIGRRAKYTLGVDSTEPAIDFANRHYRQEGKIEFMLTDITKLKLERKFDRAFLVHTLEHLPPELCLPQLRLIFNLLKPGGKLHIAVPTEASLISRYERVSEWLKKIPPWDPTHLSKFTVSALTRLGRKSGFQILGIERKLFPSRKLNALNQRLHLPGWLQNPFTQEAFISLLKG